MPDSVRFLTTGESHGEIRHNYTSQESCAVNWIERASEC